MEKQELFERTEHRSMALCAYIMSDRTINRCYKILKMPVLRPDGIDSPVVMISVLRLRS